MELPPMSLQHEITLNMQSHESIDGRHLVFLSRFLIATMSGTNVQYLAWSDPGFHPFPTLTDSYLSPPPPA
jgi:hypothetical protein